MATIKPKKKRTAVVLGCDQCRRRKTKCDQVRPTCGPCLYAGLMECTFLLGKTPASKRKKPTSEVEILEARLETIESTYSERLSQMETLLSKVMPSDKEKKGSSKAAQASHASGSGAGATAGINKGAGASSSSSSKATQRIVTVSEPSSSVATAMDTSNDDGWMDINSPLDKAVSRPEPPWIQGVTSPSSMTTSVASPASSIAPSFASTFEQVQAESSGDDEDLGELATTMDKLRLFDASIYFGKGSMLFTSTDQNQFWDEEISFDVHDVHNIDIPIEATILPPVEVIDALFDIYYQTLGTPFFERARMVLDYCIGIPRLSTVQGLIMLSRYPRISGLGHSYRQQAITMALDLGLHRKCDRWIPDKQVQESRMRVFWCIYGADSSSASVTGRRPVIDDTEIDVPMIVPIEGESETETAQTLFLVYICRLWRIFRNIKRYIFNASEVQDMIPGSLPKSYEQQLIQWQLQLPAAIRFNFDMKPDDPQAQYNSRAGIAQMLYESALILLHKPYLSSSEHLKRSPYRSQDICIKAATKITDIAKVLAQTYPKAFELTSVAEYAMLNAVRIHVMYMKSSDAPIAQEASTQFDYILRFFREFYSSPRANCDEQSINCVLEFFDEFMHSVKGLSQATVHICAGAIKNLAIAKRSRIVGGRRVVGHGHKHGHGQSPHQSPGQEGGSGSGVTAAGGRHPKNISRLVKIGKQERAKARGGSMLMSPPLPQIGPSALTSPSATTATVTTSLHRKRHSQLQHEAQQRVSVSGFQDTSMYTTMGGVGSRSGPVTTSAGLIAGNTATNGYMHPGKLQKVSQFISPFAGPQVMESLKQFQTSKAILSQPQVMGTMQQPLGNASATASDLFPGFGGQNQHQQVLTMALQQQQQQQQQQLQIPPQQAQQLYGQIGQQVGLFDTLNPSFWNDMNTSAGLTSAAMTTSFLSGGNTSTGMMTTGVNPGQLLDGSITTSTASANITGTPTTNNGSATTVTSAGVGPGTGSALNSPSGVFAAATAVAVTNGLLNSTFYGPSATTATSANAGDAGGIIDPST
ncbi:hypothetical protein BGW38_001979, partial [Lunasporangiospora selenospora]